MAPRLSMARSNPSGAGHPLQDRRHPEVGGGGQHPGLGVVAGRRPDIGRPGQLLQPLPWVGDLLQGGDDLGGVASFPQLEGGRDQLPAVTEVPVEAALAGPQPAGLGLHRHPGQPVAGQRLQGRPGPVVA